MSKKLELKVWKRNTRECDSLEYYRELADSYGVSKKSIRVTDHNGKAALVIIGPAKKIMDLVIETSPNDLIYLIPA